MVTAGHTAEWQILLKNQWTPQEKMKFHLRVSIIKFFPTFSLTAIFLLLTYVNSFLIIIHIHYSFTLQCTNIKSVLTKIKTQVHVCQMHMCRPLLWQLH